MIFFKKRIEQRCHLAEKTEFYWSEEITYSFTYNIEAFAFGCLDFGSEVQYLTVFRMFDQISRSLSATGLSSTHRVLQNARGNFVDIIEM